MYGSAETVVGDLAAELGVQKSLFLATKVWTRGKRAGIRQMEESMRRMRSSRIDLIQVHNLSDWRTQLNTLREWKEAGRIRYLGVTHYQLGTFGEIERLIKTEKLDFIEIPYSITTRKAEERLLPAAADNGTAVIAHTPFDTGGIFRRVRGKALPAWAAEFDCQSWGQFFLKYLISHPALTCAIPATTRPKHLVDNMGAGFGRLPDAATRRKMVEHLGRV
jgi:diketogulonate reductase-like aldo/keto reductase